ncbi:MAG: NERD domain-containing protein [Leptospiraceae bacterium]|nr:NERD domain-containing protein [Leptospiraceae bacterium]
MARIFPNKFPLELSANPLYAAERKVFEALSRLADQYSIFYSLVWRNPQKSASGDGEIDFLVVHEDKGVLFLEIKGGGLSFDLSKNHWFSISANGHPTKIQNPFQQVLKNKHAFIGLLSAIPEFKNKFYLMNHCVVLPDARLPSGRKKELDFQKLILYSEDLLQLEEVFNEILIHSRDIHKSYHTPGKDFSEVIQKQFYDSFTIQIASKQVAEDLNKNIILLTRQQAFLLEFLKNKKDVLINGGAGTGKTLLAIQKAKELASRNKKVLFLCFNKPLANHIQSILSKFENLDIFHFHDLCIQWSQSAGVQEAELNKNSEYWSHVLPSQLEKAIEINKIYFDAIIVDEGQDFLNHWWNTILSLLKVDYSNFYIFYDENQKLYGNIQNEFPIKENPFYLGKNVRNSFNIFSIAKQFYISKEECECLNPEGLPVSFYERPDNAIDMEKLLVNIIQKLIVEEKIPGRDIVLLSGRSKEKSFLSSMTSLGNFNVTNDPQKTNQALFYDSIWRFKGLEKNFIILLEIDELFDDLTRFKEALYVGMTRAKVGLHVVTSQMIKEKILRTD